MFSDFRTFYRAKLEKIFLTPADTFDNVKGQFPIGFFIWNTSEEQSFEAIEADVYDKTATFVGTKSIWYVAEKLNGSCQFSVTDTYFILRVIL